MGRIYLKEKGINQIISSLDLDINGYRPTDEDMMNLLDGNYLGFILKLGAKQIDDGLEIPYGTAKALIDNPSLNCTVKVQNKNISCLQNLLAINGKEKLGDFFGLLGQVTLSGNLAENFGQEKIEEVLDKLYSSPILPPGWFSGADLAEIAKNISRLLHPEITQSISAALIKEGEKTLLKKFGFGDSYSLAGLKSTEFIQNSEPYNIALKIDRALTIAEGSTASLFRGEITVQDYKLKVKKAFSKDSINQWAIGLLPGDIGNFLQKNDLSLDDLKSFYYFLNKDEKYNQNNAFLAELINKYNQQTGAGGDGTSVAVSTVNSEYLLGQAIIESSLSPNTNPTSGWFGGKILNYEVNSLDDIIFKIAYDYTIAPQYKTLAAASYAAADKDLQRLMDSSDILRTPLKMAETIFLTKFGLGNYTLYNNLANNLSLGQDARDRTFQIDNLFHLKEMTTLDLLQKRISPNQYKEKVKKAYTNYNRLSYLNLESLLPPETRNLLQRHNISLDDLREGLLIRMILLTILFSIFCLRQKPSSPLIF